MGGGKSQSAITYMNEHPELHFVYVTPFIDETVRITKACPDLRFALPSDRLPQFNFSKLEHTRWLLKIGANISTTHVAFRSYTEDMLESIREKKYVLIMDEAVDVLTDMKCSPGDLKLLIDAGCIRLANGKYEYAGVDYTGTKLRDLFDMIRSNNLIRVDKGIDSAEYYYWAMPPEVLISFDDVFVLTYLFKSTELSYFCEIYSIPVTYIGVSMDDGVYRFSDTPCQIPTHVKSIRDKITIYDGKLKGDVGKNYHALSANWFKTHSEQKVTLKNNLYNFLHNENRGAVGRDIMWSCYKENKKDLRGNGYTSQHVEFNAKARNDYRHKTVLAYCVNIFVSPQRERFFGQFGIEYDVDGYALSTMIQWIWRSAIRDGKPIVIYIPSRRMRELLIAWLDSLTIGGEHE